MAVTKIPRAYNVWQRIHGIFCVYKPPGMDCSEATKTLKLYLLSELNSLPNNRVEEQLMRLAVEHNPGEKLAKLKLEHGIAAWRKEQIQKQMLQLSQDQHQLSSSQKFLTDGLKMTETWKSQEIKPRNELVAIDTTQDACPEKQNTGVGEVSYNSNLPATTLSTVPLQIKDLATTSLVCGPWYVKDHIYLKCADPLDADCSGVMVMGLGREAIRKINALVENKHLRVYHIKGRLGMATDNHTDTGVVLERSTYHHVEAGLLDKVCTAVQTQYQRLMFEHANVNPQSQEAYELACQGLLRPKKGESDMIIYNIKLIQFNSPEFTLEVHSISETAEEFYVLIHNIGLKMKTAAVCTAVRRIRYGNFTLRHALVGKIDWNADRIAKNILLCKSFVKWRNLLNEPTLRTKDDVLKQKQRKRLTDGVVQQRNKNGDKSNSELKVEKL